MAQAILRVFESKVYQASMEDLCETVKREVFKTHYPHLVRERELSRTPLLGLLIPELLPGDVTLVVPQLDMRFSDSDADFEVEVSEGSDNWPFSQSDVQKRAERLSGMIEFAFPQFAHNIFEVTGNGTGWVQYKPSNQSAES